MPVTLEGDRGNRAVTLEGETEGTVPVNNGRGTEGTVQVTRGEGDEGTRVG